MSDMWYGDPGESWFDEDDPIYGEVPPKAPPVKPPTERELWEAGEELKEEGYPPSARTPMRKYDRAMERRERGKR